MDRKKAILKMAWLAIAGIYGPLIFWFIDWIYFDAKHIFYLILAYLVWIYLFGTYIKRMHADIERDYPKENSE